MDGGEIPAVLCIVIIDRGNGHQALDPDVLLRGSSIQQGPERFRRNAALALLPADVHLQQDVLHDARLGGFLLDGGQQMFTAHALDQAGPAQDFFDLVGLQVPDEMAGLAAVSACVKVCAELLHMIFAKHVNGQGGTCGHSFSGAGLAGGAQLDLGRVAACLPGSSGHLFTDGQHGLPHLFRCFFCHKASVLLGIFCALSADELRTGAGAENVCFTDPV